MALKSNYLLAASLLLPLLARADHSRADHHTRKSEDSRSYFAVASSPYDISCVKSVLSGGNEDSCTATVDQDGHPCLWCDAGEGQGLCLTDNQAEIAQQIGIQCGENEAIEGSPYDISCAVAMFSGGDESSCTNTEDQDGQPCVWCLASADQGLCVTEQQSEIAQQMGIQCGESTTEDDEGEDEDDEYEEDDEDYDEDEEEEEDDDEDYDEDEEEEEDDEEDVAGSPYDVSCIITTLTGGDEGACTSTEDQDGDACVWCLASAGQGLCVTEQQSEIAQQAGIQCGSSTTEGDEEEEEEDDKEEDDDVAGSPYDVSCILTTLSGGDEGSCKATKDQDGEACVWCEASADQGLCLTEEQSEIAQQAGIQCGQRLDGAMFEETALE